MCVVGRSGAPASGESGSRAVLARSYDPAKVTPDAQYEQAIFQTVRDAADDVIAEGVARLEEGSDGGGPYVRLVPARQDACEIKVYPDYPTLCLGVEQHTTEMFGPEKRRVHELRQLIEAVIEGGYEWEHRQVKRRLLFIPLYSFTRLIGTFQTSDGPWVFTRQGMQPRGAVEHRSYAPYRS